MGKIVGVRCPDCGYESRLYLGAGSVKPDLGEAISRFNDNISGDIKNWRKNHSFTIYETDTVIGHCKKCGSVEEMRTISFYNSGDPVVFHNTCTLCREKMEAADFINDKIPCPRCKASLEFDFVGFWD